MTEQTMATAGERRMVTGDYAAAWGAMVSRPQVVAAYPITPQTMIIEHLAEFLAAGKLDAEMMRVESEHSAMSAVVAAEATGVRTYTATSSQGLALMHEPLFISPPMHLPIVMSVVNRTVPRPWGSGSSTTTRCPSATPDGCRSTWKTARRPSTWSSRRTGSRSTARWSCP